MPARRGKALDQFVIPLKDQNPTSRKPIATCALIVLCATVYVLFQAPSGTRDLQTEQGTLRVSADLAFTLGHAAIPCEVATGEPLGEVELRRLLAGRSSGCIRGPGGGVPVLARKHVYGALIASMFLHGGFLHLVGNLWFLWVFGNNIEDRLGSVRYLAFYLAGGVVSGLGHVLMQWGSLVPVVGASGAIAAIMGAYLVWYPRAPVLSYIPPIFVVKIGARWFLGVWFVLQFFTGANSGIAWVAHVVGFAFGSGVALLAPRPTTGRR